MSKFFKVVVEYFKPKIDLKKLVPEVDWRRGGAMSTIDDQLDCGSWAHVAVSAVESKVQIVTGKLIKLSSQELLDCCKVNRGCKGGYVAGVPCENCVK